MSSNGSVCCGSADGWIDKVIDASVDLIMRTCVFTSLVCWLADCLIDESIHCLCMGLLLLALLRCLLIHLHRSHDRVHMLIMRLFPHVPFAVLSFLIVSAEHTSLDFRGVVLQVTLLDSAKRRTSGLSRVTLIALVVSQGGGWNIGCGVLDVGDESGTKDLFANALKARAQMLVTDEGGFTITVHELESARKLRCRWGLHGRMY